MVENKMSAWALAGVAQLVGASFQNLKVSSSIPGRAHAWVADSVPGRGAYEGQRSKFLSLSSYFPLCLSQKQKQKQLNAFVLKTFN